MVLELAEDLASVEMSSDDRHALEQILLARRLGYHILWGKPDVFKVLENLTHLSPKAAGILQKARGRLTQKKSFVEDRTYRVRVSHDEGPQLERADGTVVITVPLSHFLQIGAAGCTVLLGENETDAALLRAMAQFFATTTTLGLVRVRCRLAGGGGTTTDRAFARFRDDPRFCLCIVDSDRRAPGEREGDVASRVRAEIRPAKPWATASALPCRSAENLLPSRLIEDAVQNDPDRLGDIGVLEELV